MSTVEDPVKPSSAIPTAGAKSKNVAKKSTSKPAGSLSRNGSFSSGAASPMSMGGSAPASREASPEKKLNNILNGQSKHLMNSPAKMNSGDAGNCKSISNGGDIDVGRKRQLEPPQGDGDNPAKQARMQIENLQQNQEEMLQIITGDRALTTDEKKKDGETAPPTDIANGITKPTEDVGSPSVPPVDTKSVVSNTDNVVVNGNDDDDTKENIENLTNSQVSHSTNEKSLEKEVVPISDSESHADTVETSKLCSKLTNKLTPAKTFTLGNRAKDTIKEMLTAAVSRVGHDCLESAKDPSNQTEHCDTSSESGSSVKHEEKDNHLEKLSDITTSVQTTETTDESSDCKGDTKAEEILNEKVLECDSEIKDDLCVTSSCDQSSNSPEPATSAAEDIAVAPTSPVEKTTDTVRDPEKLGGQVDGQSLDVVAKTSQQLEQEQNEELILLDAGDSDDNLEIVDESILDEEPKDTEKPTVDDAEELPSAAVASDMVPPAAETDKVPDVTGTNAEAEPNSKEPSEHSAMNNKVPDESSSTVTAQSVQDVDCDSRTDTLSEAGKSDDSVVIASTEIAPQVLQEVDSPMAKTDDVQDSTPTVAKTVVKPELTEDIVLVPDDSCKRRLSSSSSVEVQSKKAKTEVLPKSEISEPVTPSVKEKADEEDTKNFNLTVAKQDTDTKPLHVSDKVKLEKPTNCFAEKPKIQLLPKADVGLSSVCSEKIIRISKEGLEHLIQKRINAVLASPNQSQMLNEMQQRIDFLNDQLTKWKSTAKNFQTKITELTVLNRPERRRASKGPCRHVGVQCEVQASHGHHISPVKSTQKIAPRQPAQPAGSAPSSVQISQPAVPTPVSAPGQTLIVPVASASANGNVTCTLLAPSTLPPASANINNGQLRQAIHQQVTVPGKTVREMLDTHRGETVNKTVSGSTGTAQVTSSPVVLASPAASTDAGKANVKIIDLTEDEENSPSKLAVAVPGVVTTPSTGILVRPPGISPAQGTANANIRPGTYLLPLTSSQPILLQSIVNQQIRTPQGTTLVYTGPRPAGTGGQQQIIMPAPSGGQQLVTFPAAGQSQIKQGQLLLRPPGSQPVATKLSTVSTATKPSHPTTVTQQKIVPKHPAPLPTQPIYNKSVPDLKAMPPKPSLKISRVPQGIVLSWNMVVGETHAEIANYQLFAYQEGTTAPSSSLWKRVGEVKALPLPMACTLTQFQEGNKYHFAVRALDAYSRVGPFSEPSSIHLEAAT